MMKQISLTKGFVALVDDDLYVSLSAFRWHANISKRGDCVYARRQVTKRLPDGKRRWFSIFMHHVVCGVVIEPGKVVDHIDNNTLNNTRENLRIVTQKINARNRWDRKQARGADLQFSGNQKELIGAAGF